MEHLQRVWLASRERLAYPSGHLVPSPLGGGGLPCAVIVEASFPQLYTDLTGPNLASTELRGFDVAFAPVGTPGV